MKKLEIRDSQSNAFDDDAQKRFEKSLARIMRNTWPQVCAPLDDDGMRDRIGEAVDRASYHGIEEQEHVTRFAHLAFMFDVDFDVSTDWGERILAWDMPVARKLDMLERAARDVQER